MKKPTAPLLLFAALLVSFHVYCTPILNSLPSARSTIYLDFDGQAVNCAQWAQAPATCAPAGLSDAAVTEIFNRVAEDYRPFNVNISTDEAAFLAAPLSSRIRIIITPTSSWCPGVGGAAHVGSFTWGDDTPGFVFTDRLASNPKMIAECCSHESGHSVGLSHQSKYDSTCNLTATYNDGVGTGEVAWAPIMGNSYYRNMSGWNNGPTPYGCASNQDNLSIIAGDNGFGYRDDEYSDDIRVLPTPIRLGGNSLGGIISTSTDKDAFIFTLPQSAALHLDIRPFGIDSNFQGANLDVKVMLYNAAFELVRTYDPVEIMNVVIDTTLEKGDWYIMVDGTGNGNIDDYGSLGSYTINSAVAAQLPQIVVALTGRDDINRHVLDWVIRATEDMRAVTIEVSDDNYHFTTLSKVNGRCSEFSCLPAQRSGCYYRLRTVSVLNRLTYSNTIRLQNVSAVTNPFTVSTLITQEITVNALEAGQYLLSDINGKPLKKGRLTAGVNRIAADHLPAGIYVMQLFGTAQKQSVRIIKP